MWIFSRHTGGFHGTQTSFYYIFSRNLLNTERGKEYVPLSFIRGGLPEAAAASYQEDESPP